MMSRVASVLVLVLFGQVAGAAELPPGVLARLGDDRFRAGRRVDGLAFSPDGKQLLSWQHPESGLVTVTLWEAETGERIREAALNSDLFCGAAWGPNGALVVVRRADGEPKGGRATLIPDDVRVWNIADLTAPAPPVFDRVRPTRRNPRWETDLIRPVALREFREFAVAADGRRLAVLVRSTPTKKYTIEVFELQPAHSIAQLKRTASLELGEHPPDGLILPPGDERLITFTIPESVGNTRRCWLQVWDLKSGKRGAEFHLYCDTRETALSWDGQTLATPAGVGRVTVCALATGKTQADFAWPKGRSYRDWHIFGDMLGFSPDGKQLLVATARGAALMDIATGKERGRLEGHAHELSAFVFSPEVPPAKPEGFGSRIATADGGGLIRLWEVPSAKPEGFANTLRPLSRPEGHRSFLTGAELSPDGKRLLTWFRGEELVCVWDLARGALLREFTAVVDRESAIGNQPTFTPDGLAVVLNAKDRLTARDLQTGLESPLPGEMAKLPPGAAVFAPDGTAVLTYSRSRDPLRGDYSITVWDWPTGKKRCAFDVSTETKAPWDFFSTPRFSSDSSAIFPAISSPDRFDAKTGKPLSPAWKDEPHPFGFASLRAPALFLGRYQEDGRIDLLDAGSGRPLPHLRLRRPDSATQTAFSETAVARNGHLAACESEDGEVCLFEPTTGQIRRTLSGHRGPIRVLGFTPDGSRLLTAGGDHTVLVWDMRLQNVPLPDALKKETDAAKLWESLATGKAESAYLAMARLAREPEAAIKLVKMKLKPITKRGTETEQTNLADARAIELLEALDSDDARALLKELASGHAEAFRTQEAKRALERNRAVTR